MSLQPLLQDIDQRSDRHGETSGEMSPFSDTISETDSDELDGYLGSHQRAFSLLMEAMAALIIRLWIATVIVSTVVYLLRKLPVHPLRHHSGEQMSDLDIEYHTLSVSGATTPALFGAILKENLSGPVIHVRHPACSPFTQEFPEIDSSKITGTQYNASVSKWIGVVQRGGCPFDQKVFYMQQAGFQAVLIFNNNVEKGDVTVRMSAHSLGDEIYIFAGFLSRFDGMRLVSNLQIPKQPIFGVLSPKSNDFITKEILLNGLSDMAVLFVLVIFTGSGFLLFGLILNFIYNLAIYGELFAVETMHEASLIILAIANQEPSAPKLKTITFPLKTLTKSHLNNDWRLGGVKGQEACPICIEEYEMGDTVRELPCHHMFHDTCVDPWLLKHNRLCPVCKRDTLKKPKTIKQKTI